MGRRRGGTALALGCVLCLARLAGADPAPPWDVAEETRALVEADWIAQDALYPASEPFSLGHLRDLLGRGRALAERLNADAAAFSRMAAKLEALDPGEVGQIERREFYLRARRALRQVAFTNPLLNFEEILFIKRHHPKGVFHMCDQYYGYNAIPGGGLYVLSNAFTDAPRLRNVLEDATVE